MACSFLAQSLFAALGLPKEATKLFGAAPAPRSLENLPTLGVQGLVADDVDWGSKMVRVAVLGTTVA